MSVIELQHIRFGLVVTFLLLSVILNCLGVFCIRRTKHKLTNQQLILVSMSVSELTYAIIAMSKWILDYNGLHISNSFIFQISYAGVFSSFYVYCFIVLILLLDRFISVAFPLKRLKVFTTREVRYTIVATWITGYGLSLPLAFLQKRLWPRYISMGYVTIEVLVVCLSIVTFLYIGRKVERRNRSDTQNGLNSSINATLKGRPKVYKIAVLIIMTFLFLIAIPDFVVMILVALGSISSDTIGWIYSMLNLNFVVDPLIYLIMYPSVSQELRKLIGRMSTGLTANSHCCSQPVFTMESSAGSYSNSAFEERAQKVGTKAGNQNTLT